MTRLKSLLIICVTLVLSSASVVKEALEDHLKDIEHGDGEESIKHDKHRGEKVQEIDSQLTDKHQNQFTKSSDEGKWLNKDHDTKSVTDADSYKGHNTKADKAEDSQTAGFKRGHKKGHHKQGFQNSYHKDESSNKSTFFDDLSDEGDQAKYNSRLNSHDNYGGRNYHGGHNNGQEYVRDNYHGGGYNRQGDSGNKNRGYQNHERKYYLDDVENQNKHRNDHTSHDRGKVRDYHEYKVPHRQPAWDYNNQGWDNRGWDDRRGLDDRRGWDDGRGWDDRRAGWDDRRGVWDERNGWEQPWHKGQGWDYGGPGYYDDRGVRHEGGYGYGPSHGYGYRYDESRSTPIAAPVANNAPVVAHRQQTITIYEDPRYNGKAQGQLRKEEGDHLQLEFKPSNHRYAQYDAYYAPARETSGVESSKINRLVYNYRRH